MRKVVVNSTPLIVLCNCHCLEILRLLYGEILIPQAVFDEVTAKEDSACLQVKNALNWIRVEQIGDSAEKKMYRAKLHCRRITRRRVPHCPFLWSGAEIAYVCKPSQGIIFRRWFVRCT